MRSKLLIIFTFIFVNILFVCCTARANERDDTLAHYLSKSQLVVVGKILTEPTSLIEEDGVANYNFDFKISDVIKGPSTKETDIIKVRVVRFENEPTKKHPLISKDQESILFLNDAGFRYMLWETADHWFGIQSTNPNLIASLNRLNETNSEQ